MNSNIIKVADRIARNEDITMDEFEFLRGYVSKANKNKTGNSDDVVSNFVLDVREHYKPEYEVKQKEAWIYAHIKQAITKQSRFDSGTLYNPLPVPMDGYEMEGGLTPDYWYQIEDEEDMLKGIYGILHTPFEKDIYTYCILGDTPIAHIAKEHGKSAQRGKIVKDRISKRIQDFIENKGR